MSRRIRLILFLVSGAGFAALLVWGELGLPPFGRYQGPYGTILDSVAVLQRHATDVVASVTFDYRGFDTLQEEYILFAAVAAVTLLLRAERDESWQPPSDEAAGRIVARPSDAIWLIGLSSVAPVVLLGIYVVTHGHLTPGGGFQGGVILATAPMLIYLVGEYRTMRAVSPTSLVEVAEAVGAAGFVVVGLAAMIAGAAFLTNFLPLGRIGSLASAGTLPLIEVSVGLEVAAGFMLILSEFFEQTLELRHRRARE